MCSPPSTRRRVLIFEPDAEGHALEWLEHLVRYAGNDTDLSILAPAALCRALAGLIRPYLEAERVQLIALTAGEQRLCLLRLLVISAFARWWIMRRHLRLSGANAGFFLMIDLPALPLALGLGMGGPPVSGILFRPSVHYGAIGPYRPSRREWLRDWRKHVVYRYMLRNPALSHVLSLDPFFPAFAASHYEQGAKVQALPDPAHPPVEGPAPDAAPSLAFVPPGRVGFLLFGYITERKGPLPMLEALDLLPPAIAAKVAVLFAGRIQPSLVDRIEARRRSLADEQPGRWLRVENRRLEDGELASLIARSDVVLAPYQRFVGSSGVLLWAARAGRPVLTQAFGLLGRLTRDHGLGVAVDSSDPVEIAHEMARMVALGPSSFFDRAAAARFAASQTPQSFVSAVLSV
jgi:glycosyltransferase involved in cell wall biosynthesis